MTFEDEVSFQDVLKAFTKRWRFLVISALIAILIALIKHKYFPIYPANGKLLIQDPRNSQLQYLVSQAFTASSNEMFSTDTKDENAVTRAISFLDTKQFYMNLAERLIELSADPKNTELKELVNSLEWKVGKNNLLIKLAVRLEKIISFSSLKDGRLQVNVSTNRKNLSILIVNETLAMGRDHIIERELKELSLAEKYFNNEIEQVKSRLDRIESSSIKHMQKGQILSVEVERGENSKYQNDLKKIINEYQVKIDENKKRMEVLKANSAVHNNDSVLEKYSGTSLVKKLEDENQELQLSIEAYSNNLKENELKSKGLVPFQYNMEKMKSNYALEFKVYEKLRESLAKIGLQKIYAKNRVEILELENGAFVNSSPSLMIMVLVAIMISQVIAFGAIYVYELFKK